MQIGRIKRIAQQIVAATAPLVGGRTINIMDRKGMILASSDPVRIGSFHPGAAQVVKSGQAVRIRKEELSGYPGAREEINLPVTQEGQLVGVVGILGDPKEVEDAANLLRVCAELYLDQAAAGMCQAKKEARLAVLRTLVLGEGDKTDGMERFADGLTLPVKVAVADWISEGNDSQKLLLHRQAEQELAGEAGLYGVLGGRLVVLLCNGQDGRRLQERLRGRLRREVQVAVGAPAACWEDVAFSYQEAMTLLQTANSYLDAEENSGRLVYLLGSAPRQAHSRLLAPLYRRLMEGFGDKMPVGRLRRYAYGVHPDGTHRMRHGSCIFIKTH